jgi:hypothetical protein
MSLITGFQLQLFHLNSEVIMGWEGIGTAIGKISTFIPGRVEKLKNEKARLLDERSKVLASAPTVVSIKRVSSIDSRLCEINSILGNKAAD